MEDHVKPVGKWQFDSEVSACFDDMLKRSIPQIEVMRDAVTNLAARYMQPNSDILDLGCSVGGAIEPLLKYALPSNRFWGLEVSAPMREIAQNRFKIMGDQVNILDFDLRKSFGNLDVNPSVILSVLTMQFVPMEYRQTVFQDVYYKLKRGGAFILVEKVLGSCSEIDQSMVSIYYEGKRANGYTQDDIDRKRLSLEGVLVPMTAKANEDMLRASGFSKIDCFWRFLNFAGWIAIK